MPRPTSGPQPHDPAVRPATVVDPYRGRRRRDLLVTLAGVLGLVALVVGGLVAGPSAGPAAADDDDDVYVVPGEFVVRTEPGVDPGPLATLIGATEPPERLGPGRSVWRLAGADDDDDDALDTAALLASQPGVRWAEPNWLLDAPEFQGAKKWFWGDLAAPQPGAASRFRPGQTALDTAGLPVAGATGAGTVVAVVDTGVDLDHPALAPSLRPGTDLVDGDAVPDDTGNGFDDNGNGLVDEAVGHGTFVAGLVHLVAPQAQIVPVRVLDSDGQADAWRVAKGIIAAQASEPDVVNLSLGGADRSRLMADAVAELQRRGSVVVASAGNTGSSRRFHPAAAAGVLAVGAVDGRDGTAADFTNRGGWVDLAGPGVRATSAFAGGGYAVWGGTSAAAPVVAGTAALVRGVAPGLAPAQVAALLITTADPGVGDGVAAAGHVDPAAAVAAATG